jgi:serine/threonine protein kinase
VAVKQLFNESQQSIDEFLNEIVLITGVKHRNLVKLKGCCITTTKKRLLVYEYVENDDLEKALFGEFINLKSISCLISLQFISIQLICTILI